MELPPLYALVDFETTGEAPDVYAIKLIDAGVRLLQLRAKTASDRELLAVAKRVVRSASERSSEPVLVIINDRVDICLLSGASGVHLGQDDVSAKEARKLLGNKALLGLSTHNIEQVQAAADGPLDYIALGPIFHSQTKSGHAPELGVAALREATGVSSLPIVAIGGITAEKAGALFLAGASSVAVVGDLQQASSLKSRVSDYYRAASSSKRS